MAKRICTLNVHHRIRSSSEQPGFSSSKFDPLSLSLTHSFTPTRTHSVSQSVRVSQVGRKIRVKQAYRAIPIRRRETVSDEQRERTNGFGGFTRIKQPSSPSASSLTPTAAAPRMDQVGGGRRFCLRASYMHACMHGDRLLLGSPFPL